MQRKTVVIVEDYETQRLALQRDFERRNFRVGSAATVAEAREALHTLGEEIDVMVLDMRLQDPLEPDKTGPDIAFEFQQDNPKSSPEYLIHSAWAEINYYKLALRLGAAAYLSKSETSRLDIIRHVRALALKRALRLDRPQAEEKLRSISDSTKSLPAAVAQFCKDVLAIELDACLGSPYFLLLTDESGSQNCATNTDLPTGYDPIYGSLQALAQGMSNSSAGYELSEQDIKEMPSPASSDQTKVFETLSGAVLIALAHIQDFQLSLGLLHPQPGGTNHFEDPSKLAAVLAQYIRSPFVEHFVRILIQLDSQKRAMMLRSTSQLCLSLGEDQRGMVEDGVRSGQLRQGSETHEKLMTMATDLSETGTILASVATGDPKHNYGQSFEVNKLVEAAFRDLEERMNLSNVKFTVDGSSVIEARKDDVYIAVVRILQWLVQRRNETSFGVEPAISVRCLSTPRRSETIFEDRSIRLPRKLREQLFLPFSVSAPPVIHAKLAGPGLYLPLYLAKILVEEKYGGSLEDKSDELEGAVGHRLVMGFDLSAARVDGSPHSRILNIA